MAWNTGFSFLPTKVAGDTITANDTNLMDSNSEKILENIHVITGQGDDSAPVSDIKDLDSRVVALESVSAAPDVINVVHAGVKTSGLPDFLTFSGLNVSIYASASDPLRLNVANGRGDFGREVTMINFSSNQTNFWTLPATDGTYQLFIKNDSTSHYGNVDSFYDAMIIQPSTPSNGDLWYNRTDLQMEVYNSTSAQWEKNAMCPCGEAVVSGGVITEVTCYAYNGISESGNLAYPTRGTSSSFNSNIGVKNMNVHFSYVCVSPEHGYSAGEETTQGSEITQDPDDPSYPINSSYIIDRNTVGHAIPAYATLIPNKTTGAYTLNITPTKWNVKFTVKRDF